MALDSHALAPDSTADVHTNDHAEADSANSCDIEPLIDQSIDETTNDSAVDPLMNTTGIQIKIENVPLYEIHTCNDEEMDALLDEPDEIHFDDSDDDLTMVMPKDGQHKPLSATRDEMIKHENDPISGDAPFNVKVSVSQLQINIFISKCIKKILSIQKRTAYLMEKSHWYEQARQ